MFCRNCGKELTGTVEICPSCGAKPLAGKGFCQNCGGAVTPATEICLKCGARVSTGAMADVSSKSRLALTLLAFFLGELGIHRFYAGKIATGVIMLILTLVGYATVWLVFGFIFLVPVWIWNLIDFIVAVVGKFKDKEGKLIVSGHPKPAR